MKSDASRPVALEKSFVRTAHADARRLSGGPRRDERTRLVPHQKLSSCQASDHNSQAESSLPLSLSQLESGMRKQNHETCTSVSFSGKQADRRTGNSSSQIDIVIHYARSIAEPSKGKRRSPFLEASLSTTSVSWPHFDQSSV